MSDFIGRESLPPDGYLQPRRYRIHYKCMRCGHEYSRITTRLDRKDPPCPRQLCKEIAAEEEREKAAQNMAAIIEEQRAPATIGDSPVIKAIDRTAEIVMQDHGLTDLRDRVYEGEPVAPKLPPDKQRAADSFFTGAEVRRQVGPRVSKQMDILGRRAIAGSFRNMALNPAQVVPGARGDPALRLVRKEKI